MNRQWFLFFGGLGMFVSLAPLIPAPEEWKPFMVGFPVSYAGFLTFLGNQAYDRNPDGSKSTGTGTGDGTKGVVAAPSVVLVQPPVKAEEPLVKP
jgi:hypothetical protein